MSQRLESWKEIAAYLRRSERTVRRWEDKEGLPVHRHAHDKRGSVYAFSGEIDTWRASREPLLNAEPVAEPAEEATAPGRRRLWLWAGSAALVAVLVAAAIGWLRPPVTATAKHTPDPEARRLLELASFGGNAGRTQVETGLKYIEEAVRRDPGDALVWSRLATAHLVRVWFSEVRPAEAFAMARKEARQAIELDPSLGSPWRVLGFINHYADWDQATAEAQFRKAIELGPHDAATWSWFGDYLTDHRRFTEARTYYRKAQDVAPRWLEPIAFVGNTHFFAGNPEMAIVDYNHYLGRALVATGAHDDGIARLRKSNDLLGAIPFSLADLGYALAVSGQRSEAETLRDDLLRRRDAGYYPAFPIAVIEMGLGPTTSALDWLERAAEERHMGFYLPSVDPVYDPVRADPRFIAVLQRMGIP